MARPVIVVNGLPGAGKTTLARALSRRLLLPLFSKDVIKEAHADVFGADPPDGRPQRSWNAMFGAAANETMWALVADAPGGAVLDTPLPGGEMRDRVAAGLSRAGAVRPLQVWCQVPVSLARARFDARQAGRHPIHGTLLGDEEWERRWAVAEPLPIPDTLQVDTTADVDMEYLSGWVERVLRAPVPGATGTSYRAGRSC